MIFRDKFWGNYYGFLEHALDATEMQEKAIAQNLANANNPNYHPIHVSFEKELAATDPAFVGKFVPDGSKDYNLDMDPIKFEFDPEFHALNSADFQPTIIRDPVAHVDVNKEMSELAKAKVMYDMLAVEDTPSQTKYIVETFK